MTCFSLGVSYGKDHKKKKYNSLIQNAKDTNMGQINRDDMLELTRRFTSARSNLVRIAGAYIDEEGYIDGTFNTSFLNLKGAEKNRCLDIAKAIPFAKSLPSQMRN